jgi:hypothetical protein
MAEVQSVDSAVAMMSRLGVIRCLARLHQEALERAVKTAEEDWELLSGTSGNREALAVALLSDVLVTMRSMERKARSLAAQLAGAVKGGGK